MSRPSHSNSVGQSLWHANKYFVFLLGLGLAVRVYVMITQKVVIENEGAEYARMAENFLAGRGLLSSLEEQLNLMYAPLYPILLGVVAICTSNFELAGRLVSVVSGALLILPMYFIAAHLYNKRTAQICAALVALHPLLIGFSTTVLTEAVYLTLMMAGVYWGLRCLPLESLRSCGLAGVFFGLAYLTRPEAIAVSVLTVVLVIVLGFIQNRGTRRIIACSAVVFACFAMVAIPYISFLRFQTGKFIVEAKSKLNYTIGTRFNSGMPYNKAAWGISEDLAEEGPLRESYRYAAFTPYPTGVRDIVRYLLTTSNRNKGGVYQTLFGISFGFGPILLLLAFLGWFGEGWNRERLICETYLFSVLLFTVLVVLSAHLLQFRYFLPVLPLLLIWVSKGIEHLSRWAKSTAASFMGTVSTSEAKFVAAIQSLACLIILVLAMGGAGASELTQGNQDQYPLKEAGLWLKQNYPGSKSIMTANSIVIPYYSEGIMMALPYADSSLAVRYIRKKKPHFIALEGRLLNLRPYTREWLEKGIPDAAAQLIYSKGASLEDRIAVFKFNENAGSK